MGELKRDELPLTNWAGCGFSPDAKIAGFDKTSPHMSTKPKSLDEKELPAPASTSHGTSCARALLERHNIPKHRQSPVIAEALEKSLAHAYRLLKGETPWSFELLERLGRYFGEELGDVLSFGLPDTSIPALLAIDQTRVPCRIWLDEKAQEAPAGALVAERNAGEWVVSLQKNRGHLAGKLVQRLVVQPPAAIWRVAVLDDDKASADSLVTALAEGGFDAEAFYAEDALRDAIAQGPFDAYLLDWIVGAGDARGLVASIRQRDEECPIGVMTGEIDTGRAVEADLRDAMKQYSLFFIEKPFRAMLLATQLTQAFAAR